MTARGILVVGAGSWGTTFAVRLARLNPDKRPVMLFEHFPEAAADIAARRENRSFLPGVKFPPRLGVSNNLRAALEDAEFVFNAVPTQFIRDVYRPVAGSADAGLWRKKYLVNLSKGIEVRSGKPIARLFQEILPGLPQRRYVALSGPSHAEEVILDIPTAVVAAGYPAVTALVQRLVSDSRFRVYTNSDVTGVELAGALKNCIAVASGICVGLGFGDNTLAAIITRGIAEISRLGVALGAHRETFAGLAGIGDLVVTCASRHSRNRRFGELLAKGRSPAQIRRDHQFVAEGVATAKSAVRLAGRVGVEIPIIREIYRVIYHRKNVHAAVKSLLARPSRTEWL